MGSREIKKQKTRKAISDMATTLFIERGYHEVTTAEIAARAEVSVPTLFNYFPTKEALVFDEDIEIIEKALVDAITSRKKGQSMLDALLASGLQLIATARQDAERFAAVRALIERTPELDRYSQRLWMSHESALVAALRHASRRKLSPVEAGAIARFVLDAYYRALRAGHPRATLRALFKLLREGWRG